MKAKEQNTNWPDEVRLKMVERSERYSPDQRVYQYGYYDGYQLAQQENERLRKLLKVAKCPNNCTDGVVAQQVGENEWQPEPCQWCHERENELNNGT